MLQFSMILNIMRTFIASFMDLFLYFINEQQFFGRASRLCSADI